MALHLCRALALAADIARSAPLSLRMAKAAINHGLDVDLATGLRMVCCLGGRGT
jgi:methylglutaconyl-CoA hydratase